MYANPVYWLGGGARGRVRNPFVHYWRRLRESGQGAGKLPAGAPWDKPSPLFAVTVWRNWCVLVEHSTGFQLRLSQHRFDLQISVCALWERLWRATDSAPLIRLATSGAYIFVCANLNINIMSELWIICINLCARYTSFRWKWIINSLCFCHPNI